MKIALDLRFTRRRSITDQGNATMFLKRQRQGREGGKSCSGTVAIKRGWIHK